MNTSNKFHYSLSNAAILQVLGEQIRQMRLNKNITQAKLADIAGVSRTTIQEIEKTGLGSLSSFIQILRALEKLELLNYFIEETFVSPLQVSKLYGKTRARATHSNLKKELE
jgi:transcriptional regulator with XRE-family HTH domain